MSEHETEIFQTKRATVPALEALLGVKIPVLNDGFVVLVDYMGDDYSIVQAARTSYGKGTKKVSEDRGLIRYLMRHRHTTPFEMCELKLHMRVPMDCWRQWIRHRMANVNEYSTRYSEAIDARQETLPTDWRSQSTNNKQGSAGRIPTRPDGDLAVRLGSKTSGEYLSQRESDFHSQAMSLYRERLEFGVAREQARKDLPLSTYTEAYWKCDLHNLMHFLGLRMDSHAQEEIRTYATVIGEQIVSKWVPMAWGAFKDYRMGAQSYSTIETALLRSCIELSNYSVDCSDHAAMAALTAAAPGWFDKNSKGELKKNRERDEFETKLSALGVPCPWKGD